MEQELERLEGTVEDIIYLNEDNGYTVFEVSGGGVVTVVCGVVGELHAGESVVCRGRYENHATYGRQFHAQECETDMPKDLEAVYAFLASRSLPYIGARTADKIIDKFGAAALEVIANDPAQLTLIPGISADKADRIQQEFKRMFGMRELIAYLAQFEISPRRAMEVFRTFGPGAMQAIQQNPYLLCGEPLQLDFRHADSIAQYYQMAGDCAQRLEAALLRTLRHNAGNGHTCLPRAQLLETASNFIHQPPEKLAAALDSCIQTGKLAVRMFDGTPYIYLPDLLAAEQDIADRLAMLTRRGKQTARNLDKNIQILELAQGFAYAPLQKEAIRKAMTENCLVLTGGPGTGKTTILNGILSLLGQMQLACLLAAPTGRAAKRLTEVTGENASTIHRLLEAGIDPGTGDMVFVRDEDNPLKCDAVIVDEMSMVDVLLFEHLLRALRLSCKVVLVGDCDQLPSVGAGNLLRDLIHSDRVPVVALKEIFRQAQKSSIITNAHKIIQGEHPDLSRKDSDCFFFQRLQEKDATQLMLDLVKTRLPNAYGYSPMEDIQVITPSRKGSMGVIELNQQLQAVLNPKSVDKPECRSILYTFREGDKVMQIKNNYDIIWHKDGENGTGIFNGDIGYLRAINRQGQEVIAEFDGRRATYPFEQLDQLELAYAVTVHKSQGSEFQAVVMPLLGGFPKLYYRNLLYTAVTRARRLLILIGSQNVIYQMVDNNRRMNRYTCLRDMLEQQKPTQTLPISQSDEPDGEIKDTQKQEESL